MNRKAVAFLRCNQTMFVVQDPISMAFAYCRRQPELELFLVFRTIFSGTINRYHRLEGKNASENAAFQLAMRTGRHHNL